MKDRWFYKSERIEVVKKYKYLRVALTTTLPWEYHIKEKSCKKISYIYSMVQTI